MSNTSPRPLAVRVDNISKTYSELRTASMQLRSLWRRIFKTEKDENEASLFDDAGFVALQDISFDVYKGESVGIIGVNGSGKSTLLRIIAGNLRPTTGLVEVEGNVGILDYGSGINEEYTGRENVYLKAAILGMSKKQMGERFDKIAEYADIGDFMDKPVKTYSSGMQARLGFAILAHVDVDILITDEALAVGDMFFVQKSMRTIRQFLEKGTFLFVSHAINDVLALCEKAIWLEHGRIRAMGPTSEVVNAYLESDQISKSKAYVDRKNEQTDSPDNTDTSDAVTLSQPDLSERMHSRPSRMIKDPRHDFLNHTQWRNDIKIPLFEGFESGFGVGGARIIDVRFEDDDGSTLSWVIGAEPVSLKVEVLAEADIDAPIIGFQLKDRLGQTLIADNTYLTTIEHPFPARAGERIEAEFLFQMPLLPVGEYVVRIAVASGVEDENATLHCIDDALVFQSITSGARHGLVGMPMESISLRRVSES